MSLHFHVQTIHLCEGCNYEECRCPREDGTLTATQEAIVRECASVCEMLLAKNRQYGNSATNPLRVFSRASSTEQLRVRIDDKLSRLARGSSAGEDTVLDLIGYLILLRVAQQPEGEVRSDG